MIQTNISLTEETAAIIHRSVESGLYANESELIRDAIRRLEIDRIMLENAKYAKLKSVIDNAIDEADSGKLVGYDLGAILSSSI